MGKKFKHSIKENIWMANKRIKDAYWSLEKCKLRPQWNMTTPLIERLKKKIQELKKPLLRNRNSHTLLMYTYVHTYMQTNKTVLLCTYYIQIQTHACIYTYIDTYNLIHCLCTHTYNIVQSLWKRAWPFLTKLNLWHDPAITTYPRESQQKPVHDCL